MRSVLNRWHGAMALLSALLMSASPLLAGDGKASDKNKIDFGVLRTASVDEVKAQAKAWLESTGKTDADSQKAFDAIWASQRDLVDKVGDTLALGDAAAAKLLAESRDPSSAAPLDTPTIFSDAKLPIFFRANLALAYARNLSQRRIYEEAWSALKTVKPEQVVDPSAYLFHRAVAAFSLMLKNDAVDQIVRLTEDTQDSPDRYKTVVTLMDKEMKKWQGKDLGWISRKMQNIERRLDLARGGPKTQKMQKEVLARLDEIIKQLDNAKGGGGGGGGCPSGGGGSGPGAGSGTTPQSDSNGGNQTGQGKVDPKKLKETAEQWGRLPPKEREKALLQLTRDLDPRYRQVIQKYFEELSKKSDAEK